MLVSMLVATGPKAFLMAMAIPLGQSAISFLLDAIWGRRRSNRDDSWRGPFQEYDDEEEDANQQLMTAGNITLIITILSVHILSQAYTSSLHHIH